MNDPFYKDIVNPEEAGYFDNGYIPDYCLDTMTTGLYNVETAPENTAILIATGCFAPIHPGHINMLEAAKAKLLEKYSHVIGYIAPDHDEYVKTKTEDWNIDQRAIAIHNAIKNIKWLNLDMWAGLFCTNAVNFTEIIERLAIYIKKHTGKEYPIYLVIGGDNHRFAKAFKYRGGCVVVSRPGYEIEKVDYKNVFYTEGNVDESSTSIRKSKPSLTLRVQKGEEHVIGKLSEFYSDITVVNKIKFTKVRQIISLDPLTPGDYNLEISRNFDWLGIEQIGYCARPETNLSIYEQVSKIPSGEYDLLDDDIFTGSTIKFALSILKCQKIINIISNTYNSDEVLDARDFIDSGLVIRGKRYPYVLPYVYPAVRCSVCNSFKFSESLNSDKITSESSLYAKTP